ncbi:hypothetical protein LCGC14_1215580 [marine sediment metagenome]|uniref:FecR protein domain-containing protein n=1 Tax=marine sediment metagenome TaxID=412755 RepID=A0A0F9LGW7_9ZZZZ
MTKEEESFFKKWLSENDENFLTFQRLKGLHQNNIELPDSSDFDSKEAWQLLLHSQAAYITFSRRKKYRKIFRYAAVCIGLVGCFLFYSSASDENRNVKIKSAATAVTLELGNGETQILSESNASSTSNHNDRLIYKKGVGVVDYSKNEREKDKSQEVLYNTIRIPNGKRFEVILSDGTVVKLNAGSSLKFPVTFIKGQNRVVNLIGEAFFDVKKDENSPFIVETETMDVRVLGTKFNLTSYSEDIFQSTVLVEGSVSLYKADTSYNKEKATILSPGFKADWNTAEDNLSIVQVDTDTYTGWVEGKLVLKKMNFSTIIQRLQRHYDVIITNEFKELNDRRFTATFQNETIQEVLDTFTVETPFDYTIKGNKIKISKKSIDKKSMLMMRLTND